MNKQPKRMKTKETRKNCWDKLFEEFQQRSNCWIDLRETLYYVLNKNNIYPIETNFIHNHYIFIHKKNPHGRRGNLPTTLMGVHFHPLSHVFCGKQGCVSWEGVYKFQVWHGGEVRLWVLALILFWNACGH